MQFRKSVLFLSLIGFMFLSSSAFADLQSGDFYYTVSDDTVTITGYTCPGGPAVIPPSINNMQVVSIGDSAFYYCSGLTSVTIPNSVTSIGAYAFYGCTGLTSVTIGNSVTSIGIGAFYGCTGLTSVTIPNSVTSIGAYAFYGCTGLTSVTIGNSVTSMGDYAFGSCTSLTSVTIENGVTRIGGSAFDGCTSLTSVTIGNSVTSIGDGAFYNCPGLTSVTIPNSVTSIGIWAFNSCTGLTSVTIGNSVTSIGEGAFGSCTGLTRAYFLGNAPWMGWNVFNDCSSNFKVCYTAGSTGFTTPTWDGYPAAICDYAYWETLYEQSQAQLQQCQAALQACQNPTTTTTAQATNIELSILDASPSDKQVILKWKTETEADNAGFNVWRADNFVKVNSTLIPALGSSVSGSEYEFVDQGVLNGKRYFYLLEDIDTGDISTFHGPVNAVPRWIYGIGK